MKTIITALSAICILISTQVEAGVVIGDINGDDQVGLSEAIHALQVTSGQSNPVCFVSKSSGHGVISVLSETPWVYSLAVAPEEGSTDVVETIHLNVHDGSVSTLYVNFYIRQVGEPVHFQRYRFTEVTTTHHPNLVVKYPDKLEIKAIRSNGYEKTDVVVTFTIQSYQER